MSEHSTDGPALESEGASTHKAPSYEIAREDAALAESIASFHPLKDTAGPVSVVGAVKLPTELTREMLPPDVRVQVDLRMANIPKGGRTAETEKMVMREEAEKFAYAVRVWGGAGESADPYQQEHFLLENDIFDVQRKLSERLSALEEVVRHDRKTDENGEYYDEPVYRLQGDGRSAAEYEVASLRGQLALLQGSEGKRRMDKALHEAVQQRKALLRKAEVEKAAHRRAEEILHEEEVEERATAYAKMKRTER